MDEILFLPDSHQYFCGDVELPSVTHICRFLSVDIAENAKPWLRDAAAAKGTAIHEACEAIDYGIEPDNLTPEYAPYVEAYRRFLRDYQIKGWSGVEVVMGSKALGYAGTADRIGMIDGQLAILDIKTGSTMHTPSLTAQLTAYWHLYSDQHDASAQGLYGLHLKNDGKYTLRKVHRDISLFGACKFLDEYLAPKRRTK